MAKPGSTGGGVAPGKAKPDWGMVKPDWDIVEGSGINGGVDFTAA